MKISKSTENIYNRQFRMSIDFPKVCCWYKTDSFMPLTGKKEMCANAMLLVMKIWMILRIGEKQKKNKLNRQRKNAENPVTITKNKATEKLLSDNRQRGNNVTYHPLLCNAEKDLVICIHKN